MWWRLLSRLHRWTFPTSMHEIPQDYPSGMSGLWVTGDWYPYIDLRFCDAVFRCFAVAIRPEAASRKSFVIDLRDSEILWNPPDNL